MPPQNRLEEPVDIDQELEATSNYPAFLYPCQIETRFPANNNRKLKIRIFPDQIAISRLEKKLTEEEFLDGKNYHSAVDAHKVNTQLLKDKYGDEKSEIIIRQTEDFQSWSPERELTEEEKDGQEYHYLKDKPEAIWRKMATDYLPHRASWIIHSTDNIDSLAQYRDPEKSQNICFEVLPSFFLFTIYPHNRKPVRKLKKVMPPLALMSLEEGEIFNGEASWIANFDIAVEKGMAVEFDLPDQISKIDKIIVVGIYESENGADLLEELLENHHYTSGMGFLKYNTATNNSEDAESGYSRKGGIEERYEQEFGEGEEYKENSNASQLANALGLGERGKRLLHKWQYGRDQDNEQLEDLYRVLWRVTGKYFLDTFLKGVLPDNDLERLGQHFKKYVRPQGYLPSIRLGNIPYGVLPVTQIKRWKNNKQDSYPITRDSKSLKEWIKFDKGLHEILKEIYSLWEETIKDPISVPRVGDTQNQEASPDEDLVRILAMSATSRKYFLRPYVDDRLIAWFLDQLKFSIFDFLRGKKKPDESAKEWVTLWRKLQEDLTEFLVELGVDRQVLANTELMEMIAWSDTRPLTIPLVSSETNPNDNPENYIPVLDQLGGEASPYISKTLLYSLLHRALKHDPNVKPWKLLLKSGEEVEQKILEFFNNVRDPQEIVDRIMDDPRTNKMEPAAYAIRPSLARLIIEERNKRENKKFTSIDQIDQISGVGIGVGKDTLRDIIFSFEKQLEKVDYESLLRGVVDVFTHRLDAWISSLASKRLVSMRERSPKGIIVGAYGFVENLPVPNTSGDRLNFATGGYIHAPSVNQATTAALLKSGFMSNITEGNNPYRMNLSSDRIRRGLALLQGVREGQELGALLGYQFERDLHDRRLDQYKDEFRNAFPLVNTNETSVGNSSFETITPRNVVNGLALIRAVEDLNVNVESKIKDAISKNGNVPDAVDQARRIMAEPGIQESIDLLREAMDGIADLLIHESVFQVVSDKYERSKAAMDAAAGLGRPPEIESITTPLESDVLSHRVILLFEQKDVGFQANQPREKAEPRIASWFSKMLGDASKIGCCVKFNELTPGRKPPEEKFLSVTLKELEISPLDFLYISANQPGGGESEIEQRIKSFLIKNVHNLIEAYSAAEIMENGEVKKEYSPEVSPTSLIDWMEKASKPRTKIIPTPIKIDFGPFESNSFKPANGREYSKSLQDAITMANQVLSALSQAIYAKPENLCEADAAMKFNYSEDDFNQLAERVHIAFIELNGLREILSGYIEPLVIVEAFSKASSAIKKLINEKETVLADENTVSDQALQEIKEKLIKNIEQANELQDLKIKITIPDDFEASLKNIFERALKEFNDQNPEPEPEELTKFAGENLLDKVSAKLLEILKTAFTATVPDEAGEYQFKYDDEYRIIVGNTNEISQALTRCTDHVTKQIMPSLEALSGYGFTANRNKLFSSNFLVQQEKIVYDRLQKANLQINFAKCFLEKAKQAMEGNKEMVVGEIQEQMTQGIRALVRGMKALFGENFVVLPTFILPDKENFKVYIGSQDKVLKGNKKSRFQLWLQQAAQTHSGVQRLEDALLISEIWSDQGLLEPFVVQLPYQMENDQLKDSLGWQALSDEELGIDYKGINDVESREDKRNEYRPRSSTSLVILSEEVISTDKVCGLIIDDWIEQIPNETVDTAIAFHADTPNQQPPNCFLLAVPGDRKINGKWTPRELEAIVSDTLDLARIRTVDLDALPDLKGLLPALFLPIAPDQDFFKNDLSLTRLKDVSFLAPTPDNDG